MKARLAHERQIAHMGDDLERRTHRTLGVVLVGERYAEEPDDGVAYVLLHCAAEALDHAAGEVEIRAEGGVDVLGVMALAERREADEVGEEGGHDLALGGHRRGARQSRPAGGAETGAGGGGRGTRGTGAPHVVTPDE